MTQRGNVSIGLLATFVTDCWPWTLLPASSSNAIRPIHFSQRAVKTCSIYKDKNTLILLVLLILYWSAVPLGFKKVHWLISSFVVHLIFMGDHRKWTHPFLKVVKMLNFKVCCLLMCKKLPPLNSLRGGQKWWRAEMLFYSHSVSNKSFFPCLVFVLMSFLRKETQCNVKALVFKICICIRKSKLLAEPLNSCLPAFTKRSRHAKSNFFQKDKILIWIWNIKVSFIQLLLPLIYIHTD